MELSVSHFCSAFYVTDITYPNSNTLFFQLSHYTINSSHATDFADFFILNIFKHSQFRRLSLAFVFTNDVNKPKSLFDSVIGFPHLVISLYQTLYRTFYSEDESLYFNHNIRSTLLYRALMLTLIFSYFLSLLSNIHQFSNKAS